MKTHGSATTFHVSDLATALAYYTSVLGFEERFRFGDYAGVQMGDVHIHLSGPASTNKKQVGQGSIYIFCDGVDDYYAQVKARGASTQEPPKDYEYGMRAWLVSEVGRSKG